MVEKTPFEALCACEKKAGTQAQMARDLGCSHTAIWKMFQSAKRMSTQYVLTAERIYGISRHDLDPITYPRDLPPAPGERFYGVDRDAKRVTL